jgi:hypothetical protein
MERLAKTEPHTIYGFVLVYKLNARPAVCYIEYGNTLKTITDKFRGHYV